MRNSLAQILRERVKGIHLSQKGRKAITGSSIRRQSDSLGMTGLGE